MKVRIKHNRLLGGWFIVRGPHDTPLSGRFDTEQEARQSLRDQAAKRDSKSHLIVNKEKQS
jgi:hypothetical protein